MGESDCLSCFSFFRVRRTHARSQATKQGTIPTSFLQSDDVPPPAAGFFDYESAGQLPMPLAELRSRLERFDFDNSTDEDVVANAHYIYDQMMYEASKLTSSPLTSSMAYQCVLQNGNLSQMLAHFLACKVGWATLPLKSLSQEARLRDDIRKQEIALYHEMVAVLSKPAVLRAVVADLTKAFLCDPAAEGFLQLALYFKGFHAVTVHRVAHDLWKRRDPVSQNAALMMQSRASELFAVDIHPGATIGNGIMIDHATGVVIGSTAVLGNDIMMLHSVTLGATGKPTGGAKRHPTVGSGVVLGAGSIVLGDISVHNDSVIGARAIVSKDVEPGSTVVEVNKVIKQRNAASQQPTSVSARTFATDLAITLDVDYTDMWSI